MRALDLYKWCPHCKKEEAVNGKQPKIERFGTDGWGQPVKFSTCECGELYGWFFLSHYDVDKDTIDDGLKSYLQHRIKFYSEEI